MMELLLCSALMGFGCKAPVEAPQRTRNTLVHAARISPSKPRNTVSCSIASRRLCRKSASVSAFRRCKSVPRAVLCTVRPVAALSSVGSSAHMRGSTYISPGPVVYSRRTSRTNASKRVFPRGIRSVISAERIWRAFPPNQRWLARYPATRGGNVIRNS